MLVSFSHFLKVYFLITENQKPVDFSPQKYKTTIRNKKILLAESVELAVLCESITCYFPQTNQVIWSSSPYFSASKASWYFSANKHTIRNKKVLLTNLLHLLCVQRFLFSAEHQSLSFSCLLTHIELKWSSWHFKASVYPLTTLMRLKSDSVCTPPKDCQIVLVSISQFSYSVFSQVDFNVLACKISHWWQIKSFLSDLLCVCV